MAGSADSPSSPRIPLGARPFAGRGSSTVPVAPPGAVVPAATRPFVVPAVRPSPANNPVPPAEELRREVEGHPGLAPTVFEAAVESPGTAPHAFEESSGALAGASPSVTAGSAPGLARDHADGDLGATVEPESREQETREPADDGYDDVRATLDDELTRFSLSENATAQAEEMQGRQRVATVLEGIARRIRNGELNVARGANGSDAAVLAAALASLLGESA